MLRYGTGNVYVEPADAQRPTEAPNSPPLPCPPSTILVYACVTYSSLSSIDMPAQVDTLLKPYWNIWTVCEDNSNGNDTMNSNANKNKNSNAQRPRERNTQELSFQNNTAAALVLFSH